MRWCVAVGTVLFLAAPAAAQPTYVGASLVGDVARFSGIDVDDDRLRLAEAASSLDGEALGFNAKVGRGLGEHWGVELEFFRSGQIENSSRLPAVITLPLPGLDPVIFPPPNFEFESTTAHQHTGLAALLWLRQELGDRVEIAYLGGAAFSRAETERNLLVTDPRFVQSALSIAPNYAAVELGVGPAVGLEADIKFGDHAALTTGVRLHGTNVGGRHGWLIRPLAGLRWRF